MAKKSSMTFVEDFAFYEQLWNYYASNRGKIRSRYNDLTKKFLAYNDRNENPDAFLRTPQCIFRKNCASVPEERSAIPLQTEQSSAG